MKSFKQLIESEEIFHKAQQTTNIDGKALCSIVNQFWHHPNKKIQKLGDHIASAAKHLMELHPDDDLRDVAECAEPGEELHPLLTKVIRSTREYIRTKHPKHLKAAAKPLIDHWQSVAKEYQSYADSLKKFGE